MKIKLGKGKQFTGDNLIQIKTEGYEVFAIRKLVLVIHKLALNEAKKYKRALDSGGELWLPQAIQEIIDYAIKGTDLLKDSNEDLLKEFCRKWKLPFDLVKQTKLEEFENGNTN